MPANPAALGSPKEQAISSGTSLVAGTLVVNATTNLPVVVPSNETAGTLATALGASAVKTIDVPARTGAFSDSGLPIFEVL